MIAMTRTIAMTIIATACFLTLGPRGKTPEPKDRLVCKKIEEIRPGDWVWCEDVRAGKRVRKRVVKSFSRTSYHLRILQVSNQDSNQLIETTDEHPFWIEGKGWVEASKLKLGDILRSSNGRPTYLTSTRRQVIPEGIKVFNIKVDGVHNYFVQTNNASLTDEFVLVHNTDCDYVAKLTFALKGIPQGFTKSQFAKFSSSLKKVLKSEGLPDGQIFVHGSRAGGVAKAGKDVDVILRVSDKDFGKLAAKRLAQSIDGNRKAIRKTVRNQQRIRARGVSLTLEKELWQKVCPHLPDDVSKIQFSIVTEGSSFNKGPFIQIK